MRGPRQNRAPAGRSLQDRFGVSGFDLALFGGGLLGGLYILNDPVLLYSAIGAGVLGLVVFLKK